MVKDGLPWIRWVVASLLLSLGCLLQAVPASAQSSIDPRWGALGDMVEKDFLIVQPLGFGAMLTTVRWEVPNRTIMLSYWSGSTSNYSSEFTLDPATGMISQNNRGFSGDHDNLSAAADGTIRFKSGGRFLWKSENGAFKINSGQTYKPIPAGHRLGQALADLVRLGKVRAGGIASASLQQPMAPQQQPAATSSAYSYSAPPVQSDAVAKLLAPPPPATHGGSSPRIALVIGNSNYDDTLGPLANPANDARLMADRLRATGFDVELVLDADQKSMKRAISRLGERMAAGGRGATGLFYYAGHGMQSRGTNYLIPVGALIQREADVDLEAVAADTVLAQMEDAGAATNILILDACRNTPLHRRFRSATRGLARMEAPNGSFISYSTAPGGVAVDGDGGNSPFALALSTELTRPGQPIEIAFRNVRRSVLTATNGEQTPWDSSSLIDSFVFVSQ